jgi:hypothetical protein
MQVEARLAAVFEREGAGVHFHLALKPMQGNRWGYFKAMPAGLPHIAVKNNLPSATLLFIFLHEKAHWVVWKGQGRKKVRPHGAEWQEAFRNLMAPYLNPDWFDESTLRIVANHLRKPKATVGADPALLAALGGETRAIPQGHRKLRELPEGALFQVKQHTLVRGELRRTRFLCRTLTGKRSYLVHGDVPVVPLERD